MEFKDLFARRFTIGQLIGSSIAFLILGMVLVIGVIFIDNLRDQVTSTAGSQVLNDTEEALTTFSDWLPTLAFVVVGGVVLAILIVVYVRLKSVAGALE